MTEQEIWDCDTPVSEILGIDVPEWIEQDICPSTIASIYQGGCNSGAYMPAVTYHQALRTMSEDGDDVLQYICDQMGELPAIDNETSWAGMACLYLSYAVELWASSIYAQLEDHDIEEEA